MSLHDENYGDEVVLVCFCGDDENKCSTRSMDVVRLSSMDTFVITKVILRQCFLTFITVMIDLKVGFEFFFKNKCSNPAPFSRGLPKFRAPADNGLFVRLLPYLPSLCKKLQPHL